MTKFKEKNDKVRSSLAYSSLQTQHDVVMKRKKKKGGLGTEQKKKESTQQKTGMKMKRIERRPFLL